MPARLPTTRSSALVPARISAATAVTACSWPALQCSGATLATRRTPPASAAAGPGRDRGPHDADVLLALPRRRERGRGGDDVDAVQQRVARPRRRVEQRDDAAGAPARAARRRPGARPAAAPRPSGAATFPRARPRARRPPAAPPPPTPGTGGRARRAAERGRVRRSSRATALASARASSVAGVPGRGERRLEAAEQQRVVVRVHGHGGERVAGLEPGGPRRVGDPRIRKPERDTRASAAAAGDRLEPLAPIAQGAGELVVAEQVERLVVARVEADLEPRVDDPAQRRLAQARSRAARRPRARSAPRSARRARRAGAAGSRPPARWAPPGPAAVLDAREQRIVGRHAGVERGLERPPRRTARGRVERRAADEERGRHARGAEQVERDGRVAGEVVVERDRERERRAAPPRRHGLRQLGCGHEP